MKDPVEIFTRRGIPVLMIFARLLFAAYFVLAFASYTYRWFPNSVFSIEWFVYSLAMYLLAEYVYRVFLRRGIDLTFAFPLLFAIYLLNFVSLVLDAQERMPLINRAEHFTSFILIAHVVWVFFIKYLPQDVWHDHPYYTALLALCVTAALGVGNEIIELVIDTTFGTRLVGNHLDTSLDLLMNTLGSGLYLAVQLIMTTTRHIPLDVGDRHEGRLS